MNLTAPRRVWLRTDPVGEDHPTVVVDRPGGDLVVVAPIAAEGEVLTTAPGAAVVVSWLSDAGVHELVAGVILTAGNRWRLRPRTPATRVQRRAFTRVHLAAILVLRGGDDQVRVATVDLGEGGFRGLTRDASGVVPGRRFDLTLDLEGAPLDVRAESLRRQQLADGRWEVAFRFVGLHWRDADRIRGFVFGRQAQARWRTG